MPEKKEPDAITAISVKGFKSFAEETRLEIRPLTLLAGANSSGKSSAMQPILLLKQTLEANYDPGPLLLSDSHVRFTSAEQMLNKRVGKAAAPQFEVGIELVDQRVLKDVFARTPREGFELVQMELAYGRQEISLRPDMESDQVRSALDLGGSARVGLQVYRDRCFLQVEEIESEGQGFMSLRRQIGTDPFSHALRRILHVPGLRGNPSRTYRTTAVGEFFVGTFENYVASIVAAWQERRDGRLEGLGAAMSKLGLSWGVEAKAIDATQVELLVGRLPEGRSGAVKYLVNIVDVGFGVSQTLPVLVALLTAEPGQLVYLEQPEIHLHPRAQEALAEILVEAANRGVQIVAETHSSILLLAVQALVAEGKIDPAKVNLNWFQRGADGVTKVTSADIDAQGAYGDWPEDFGEVRARAENRYLDAVEAKVFPPKKPKRNAKSR